MIDNLRKRYEQLQGLLNTPANQSGGLLGNISQGALLGSAIYGQGVQGKDPFEALFPAVAQTSQMKQLLTPKQKERKIIKDVEGRQRYADTGELVFPDVKLPTKKEKRNIIKSADGFQRYEDTGEKVFPDVVAKVSQPLVQNILGAGETEFSKGLAKADVTDVVELRGEAKTAMDQNNDLNLITALSANLKTGAGGVLLQDLAKIGERFGVDMNWLSNYGQSQTIANSEAVQVLSSNVTLDAISKTKGSISDKEMTFFQSIAPNLGMTNEGIAKTAFIKEKLNNRILEKNNFMEQWISDGTRPTSLKDTPFGKQTFNQYWNSWVNQKKDGNLVNPIFTDDEIQELTEANSVKPDNLITDKKGNQFLVIEIPGQKNKYIPIPKLK